MICVFRHSLEVLALIPWDKERLLFANKQITLLFFNTLKFPNHIVKHFAGVHCNKGSTWIEWLPSVDPTYPACTALRGIPPLFFE
jgi:hypothetical protein